MTGKITAACLAVCLALFGSAFVRAADEGTIHKGHALAMSGEPKYKAGFTHFEYANPDAPKFGFVKMAAVGTYDSLNPFIPRGNPAGSIALIYDTLTVQSDDEPFTQYGLIADSIETPADRSWVSFHVNPAAKFHDGKPITAEDVIFTFKLLTEKGSPVYQKYYADVTNVEKLDEATVRFTFKKGETNAELPLILGQLYVLPKHFWEGKDFSQTSLDIPLGSGPYQVGDFKAGNFIEYNRVEHYWAKDHPVRKGFYNFDRIRYDYYRDSNVILEALKAGEYDFRLENSAKNWATGYASPAVDKGQLVKETIKNEITQGMQGFAFNIRRPIFQDRKVRLAITYAFDFEWTNQQLFYGQYTRTKSYFANSELASRGLPSPEELKILEPLRGQLPEEVFTREYDPPKTDGTGNIRENLRIAADLLKEAGWEVKDRKRVNAKTGQPLTFEILYDEVIWERIILPFQQNLERLGIMVKLRMVDPSQFVNRVREFDYDMIVAIWGQSLSPGNEQRYFWGSESADLPDTQNYVGIKDPAIDKLIDLVIKAPDREALVTRTRALDRALLWGYYVVPHYHSAVYRVAFWNKFSRPAVSPKYDLGFFTWWVDAEKEKKLKEAGGGAR